MCQRDRSFVLRPSSRFTFRTDVHTLRLADRDDLWYQGGGAFQPTTFGFSGRPSNGESTLATLYDASGDYAVNPSASPDVYYGYASGKTVVQALDPTGSAGHLTYIELLLRF